MVSLSNLGPLLLLLTAFPRHGTTSALRSTSLTTTTPPQSPPTQRSHHPQSGQSRQQIILSSPQHTRNEKVPLEIHIMSKCPDAKDCMELLISPALEQVSEMVDFRMSFIGREDPQDGGVLCKHGPPECIGNMLHLCAQQIYPLTLSPNGTNFLPFSQCLLHSYPLVPTEPLVRTCAAKASLDFQRLNRCISDLGDNGGMELLKESVQRTSRVGVKASCTVRLAGGAWCVRDEGRWRDCVGGSGVRDLVREVLRLYAGDEGGEE